MTRRNPKSKSERNQNYKENKQPLEKMLDLRKVNAFRFDAREILNSTGLEEKVWNSLLASIITKASRLSIKDANDYIQKLENEEVLTKDTSKALKRLLDRYKRCR